MQVWAGATSPSPAPGSPRSPHSQRAVDDDQEVRADPHGGLVALLNKCLHLNEPGPSSSHGLVATLPGLRCD